MAVTCGQGQFKVDFCNTEDAEGLVGRCRHASDAIFASVRCQSEHRCTVAMMRRRRRSGDDIADHEDDDEDEDADDGGDACRAGAVTRVVLTDLHQFKVPGFRA